MGGPVIPAEAVEAAARKFAVSMWGWYDPEDVPRFSNAVREMLEAAAPHIAAAAWKEGEAAGQDNAYAYQDGSAVKSNPYRPTVE
jgi:hypothetical protein